MRVGQYLAELVWEEDDIEVWHLIDSTPDQHHVIDSKDDSRTLTASTHAMVECWEDPVPRAYGFSTTTQLYKDYLESEGTTLERALRDAFLDLGKISLPSEP